MERQGLRVKVEKKAENTSEMAESILKQGGFGIMGGDQGFLLLELETDPVYEMGEQPSRKEEEKMKPGEEHKAGGLGKREDMKGSKHVYVKETSVAAKRLTGGVDKFKRDMSDAPEAIKDALKEKVQALVNTPEAELTAEDKEAMKKLKPIADAMGFVPTKQQPLPPLASDMGKAPAKKPAPIPVTSKKGIQPTRGTAPFQPGRRPERVQEDKMLESLRQKAFWLVSSERGSGIAVQVAPWYDKPNRQGNLVGFKILETYRSSGRINHLPIGGILPADAEGNLGPKTLGGFEEAVDVPQELRTSDNAVKLTMLVAQDMIAPEIRHGSKQPVKPQASGPNPQARAK